MGWEGDLDVTLNMVDKNMYDFCGDFDLELLCRPQKRVS